MKMKVFMLSETTVGIGVDEKKKRWVLAKKELGMFLLDDQLEITNCIRQTKNGFVVPKEYHSSIWIVG